VADGLMVAIGGTLLLTPGFVTDIFGAILLIPPTRAVIRRIMGAYFGRRFLVVGTGPFRAAGTGPPQPGRSYDFEGTAEEVDGEDPQLGR
jgi:UPF0716 protein FxsA